MGLHYMFHNVCRLVFGSGKVLALTCLSILSTPLLFALFGLLLCGCSLIQVHVINLASSP